MSKFFTYEERLELQKYLKESLSFKEISRRLGKNSTTISREVRKYSSQIATGYPGFPYNACKKRINCRNKNVCGKECTRKASSYCKLCTFCNSNCPEFIEEVCTARLNKIISPLIQNGQSVNQIYINHQNELMCSEKTIYNYIDACLFDIRNIDLPRKVKFRERYKKPEFKVDKGCRIGRNYEAFCAFIEKNPDTAVVQMDFVIGSKGGKCFLTIHFIECSLMLTFIRDANTSKSVIDIFNYLDKTLGKDLLR